MKGATAVKGHPALTKNSGDGPDEAKTWWVPIETVAQLDCFILQLLAGAEDQRRDPTGIRYGLMRDPWGRYFNPSTSTAACRRSYTANGPRKIPKKRQV